MTTSTLPAVAAPVDPIELRVRCRLAWNNWPDSEASRREIASHEARDPYSAASWDRVIAALSTPPSEPVAETVAIVTYTNWRGETSARRIIPKSVRYGSTEWHPEPQWLLLAWDDDKKADREFALKDFGDAPPSPTVTREMEVFAVTESGEPVSLWLTNSAATKIRDSYKQQKPAGKWAVARAILSLLPGASGGE